MSLFIQNCHFKNIITAYSLDNNGLSGAIYIQPIYQIDVTIQNSIFINVTAKISGAGIYVYKSNMIDITL